MKRINYFIGLLTLSTVAVATGAPAAQAIGACIAQCKLRFVVRH
jgi:hypothetical protein